jgi:hypothetical protein
MATASAIHSVSPAQQYTACHCCAGLTLCIALAVAMGRPIYDLCHANLVNVMCYEVGVTQVIDWTAHGYGKCYTQRQPRATMTGSSTRQHGGSAAWV